MLSYLRNWEVPLKDLERGKAGNVHGPNGVKAQNPLDAGAKLRCN
jgi:hypothetical protein